MNHQTNQAQFLRTKKIIPWGTQTNAKRPVEAFAGAMPFFIERAKGCRIWDIEGREFIDYRSALGPIILGYCFEEVDQAVKAQLEKGVLFSMASPIELELAQEMLQVIPGLEGVRFLKTGGDACSAAVRVARAYSQKYKIISVGYHGWHDNFIAANHDIGVPPVLSEYVYDVAFGDLEKIKMLLDKDAENIACIIIEPFQWNAAPNFEYLRELRRLCNETGTILIFDEVLTGFRMALGGAAEYFDVVPDLAIYAKALANGYPLSAFGGKKEYFTALDKTFISATHAGDAISIAAALATLKILQQKSVHEHLQQVGRRLFDGINSLTRQYHLPLQVEGVPTGFSFVTRPNLSAGDAKMLTTLEKEVFAQNIFIYKNWFINYSHQMSDIETTLDALETAIKKTLR